MLNKDDLQRKKFKRSELQRREIMYSFPIANESFDVRKRAIISCDILSEAINKIMVSSGTEKSESLARLIQIGYGANTRTARSALYNLRSTIQSYKDFLVRYSIGKGEVDVIGYLPVKENDKESTRFIYSVVSLGEHKTVIKSKMKYFDKHPGEIFTGRKNIIEPLEVLSFFEHQEQQQFKDLISQSSSYVKDRATQFLTKEKEREHNKNIEIVRSLERKGKVEIIEDMKDPE